MSVPLLVSVFVIATCGLVYELLAGTVASYLLGDTVTQFSTLIGTYLFSMGIGSYLCKFIERRLLDRFVQIEILVGLIGGLSAAGLFLAFPAIAGFRILLYSWVGAIGILVGMEIPLLLRILKDELQFQDLVSKVLSLDYLGALFASLLFPLWLVPKLGLVRSSFLFGLINVAVGLWACRIFRHRLAPGRFLAWQGWIATAILAAGAIFSERIYSFAELGLYSDEILYAKSTPYQRIVLTRWKDDLRLYLNGHLQFSSFDEYRYHEALVHPALASHASPRSVLVLGGGDGLAVREILRDERVERITLVDLDPEMTTLFRDHEDLASLNGRSLRSPKVRIVNEDAFLWIDRAEEKYDLAFVDFPDPSNYSVGKLYTTAFYERLRARILPGGFAAIQATSPLFARRSFWCIVTTLRSLGWRALPYHALVPSFGEWGFVVVAEGDFPLATALPPGLRFLTPESMRALFEFPRDMEPVEAEVNRLNQQILVQYYESEWKKLSP